jgi:hypothetical protein
VAAGTSGGSARLTGSGTIGMIQARVGQIDLRDQVLHAGQVTLGAGAELHLASTNRPPTTITVAGGFFSTDIPLANPNSAPAPITMTFSKDDGTVRGRSS